MANVIYTQFFTDLGQNTLDWETAVLRCQLERSTSTYTENKDHEDRNDLTGFIEITVTSYARQTIAGGAVANDHANDRSEYDCNDIAFGTLESGQTVQAVNIFEQTGGDDTTPADDTLVCYVDTDADTILPFALGGGAFTVQINVEGLIHALQP
jgi:hypothetical protein